MQWFPKVTFIILQQEKPFRVWKDTEGPHKIIYTNEKSSCAPLKKIIQNDTGMYPSNIIVSQHVL